MVVGRWGWGDEGGQMVVGRGGWGRWGWGDGGGGGQMAVGRTNGLNADPDPGGKMNVSSMFYLFY